MGMFDLADPSTVSQLGLRIPQDPWGAGGPTPMPDQGGISIPQGAGASWGLLQKPTDGASRRQTAAGAAKQFAPPPHQVLQGAGAPHVSPSYAGSMLQLSPYIQAYMQRMQAMRNTLTPGQTGVSGLLGGHNGTT